MNIFGIATLVSSLVWSVNTEEADRHLYLLLDLKKMNSYSKSMPSEKSLGEIATRTTILLQMLTINKVTTNFVDLIQIIKEDFMVVDDFLILTRLLLEGLTKGIVEPRDALVEELKDEKYLQPENFGLLEELVNKVYEKMRSLQEETFVKYTEEINRIVKEFGLSEETAKRLEENTTLLVEGLFLMSKGVQENELRLYKEAVTPQK